MEGHLRLSFCGTLKEITEGIERIQWALDPNSPNELYLGDRKLVRDWHMTPTTLDIATPAPTRSRLGRQRLRAGEPRARAPAPRLLEPARTGALRGGHLPPRGTHRRRGPVRRQHRQAHGARRGRQVHRPRGDHGGEGLVGRVQPPVHASRTSTRCSRACRATCRAATCSCRTATPAPIPTTGCRSASSPSRPGTACSPAPCS